MIRWRHVRKQHCSCTRKLKHLTNRAGESVGEVPDSVQSLLCEPDPFKSGCLLRLFNCHILSVYSYSALKVSMRASVRFEEATAVYKRYQAMDNKAGAMSVTLATYNPQEKPSGIVVRKSHLHDHYNHFAVLCCVMLLSMLCWTGPG